MIQVERRAGLRLAAGVCAAVLAIAVFPVHGPDRSHKKKAPASHEPTSAELFDYIHGAMLAYSPEDQVNDNLEISIDPTATVLTIKQPDGHCDIFLSALDANTIVWDVYDASDSMQTRAPLARLTVDAIAGKKARTCYDTDNNVDPSIPPLRARILFSWALIPDGSGFQTKFTKALKKLIKHERRDDGEEHLQVALEIRCGATGLRAASDMTIRFNLFILRVAPSEGIRRSAELRSLKALFMIRRFSSLHGLLHPTEFASQCALTCDVRARAMSLCCIVGANSIGLSHLECKESDEQPSLRMSGHNRFSLRLFVKPTSLLKRRNIVNLLHFRLAAAAACAMTLLFTSVGPAQAQEQDGDKIDLAALTQIKNEAFQHSQVMENLFYISEVYGPRVNNSRNHRAAAEWAMQRMKDWGLQNVHLEKWGPFGDGWQIKKYYGALETPAYASLIGFPLAWTPGTNGPVTAEAVLAPLHSEADFAKYKGKLKGKIVLIFDPRELSLHTEAEAKRLTDEEVEERTKTPDPSHMGFFFPMRAGAQRRGRASTRLRRFRRQRRAGAFCVTRSMLF